CSGDLDDANIYLRYSVEKGCNHRSGEEGSKDRIQRDRHSQPAEALQRVARRRSASGTGRRGHLTRFPFPTNQVHTAERARQQGALRPEREPDPASPRIIRVVSAPLADGPARFFPASWSLFISWTGRRRR